MTALDDFMAEYDRPLRRVVLPDLLRARDRGRGGAARRASPELAAAARPARERRGQGRAARARASRLRLQAMLFQHNDLLRAANGALERVGRPLPRRCSSAALLDEHYLENELRLAVPRRAASSTASPPSWTELRDPVRHDADALPTRSRSAPSGRARCRRRPDRRPATSRTRHGRVAARSPPALPRHDPDRAASRATSSSAAPGRGGAAIFLRGYLEAHELADRQVWVADRFRAAADDRLAPDRADGLRRPASPTSTMVRDGFDRFDLLDDRVRFLQGDLATTLPDAPIEKIALAAARARARRRRPRRARARSTTGSPSAASSSSTTSPTPAWREADRRVPGRPRRHRAARAAGRRPARAGARPRSRRAAPRIGVRSRRAGTQPRLRSAPPGRRPAPCDLSVVVVFYNMRREAARTLHSLSRAYQQGVDDLDYEVIVVENGSAPDQRSARSSCAASAPSSATSTSATRRRRRPPTRSTAGIARRAGETHRAHDRRRARADAGRAALRHGRARDLRAGDRRRPSSGTSGPGQQADAMHAGYDQAYEDELFEQIEWPADGYRLFDIGHFIGDRDWFDGLWESNCIFVPRKLLEQVGAFDESFSMPGGGYANLELYERLGATPDVNVVTHPRRGLVPPGARRHHDQPSRPRRAAGARSLATPSTSPSCAAGRSAARASRSTTSAMFHDRAQRSGRAARRMTGEAFAVDEADEGPTGRPARRRRSPTSCRDGVRRRVLAQPRLAATRRGSATRSPNAPTDLVVYQEIITERPARLDHRDRHRQRRTRACSSRRSASCSDHGQVVSIDTVGPKGTLPEHPRITYLPGGPTKRTS